MSVLQKVFNEGRLDRLDHTLQEHKQTQMAVDTLKIQIENCISKNELQNINKTI